MNIFVWTFSSRRSELNIYLLSLSVAFKDKSTERWLSLLFSLAPVSSLHHETHQSAVLLVRCKLGNIFQLELREKEEEDRVEMERTNGDRQNKEEENREIHYKD